MQSLRFRPMNSDRAPAMRGPSSISTGRWPVRDQKHCRSTREDWQRLMLEREDFADDDEATQDSVLSSAEAESSPMPRGLFSLLLEQTRQGMFGDPMYGGNLNFAGWDLIQYPGLKLLWTAEEQDSTS